MTEQQRRARRAKRPPIFDVFASNLDPETIAEFDSAWASAKSGTEPDDRAINVLWNLINAFPADENRVHRVPQEVGDLMREWRDALKGRPGWGVGEEEG